MYYHRETGERLNQTPSGAFVKAEPGPNGEAIGVPSHLVRGVWVPPQSPRTYTEAQNMERLRMHRVAIVARTSVLIFLASISLIIFGGLWQGTYWIALGLSFLTFCGICLYEGATTVDLKTGKRTRVDVDD